MSDAVTDLRREQPRELLYRLTWSGAEVTRDVSAYVERLVFTDYVHGKSDNIEVVFSDHDHRWKDPWFPVKGDELALEIGTSRIGYVHAGVFEVDELESAGPPDTMTVRGIATNITESLREAKTRNWEGVTIPRVVGDIAGEHGLGTRYILLPEALAGLVIDRVDQNEQADLEFLRELAETYGCITKVDRGELIFSDPEVFADTVESITLTKGQDGIRSFTLRSQAHEIYKSAEVDYFLPQSRTVVTHTEEDPSVTTGDVLRITERVGGIQVARQVARQRLRQANRKEYTGSFDMFGWHGWISGAKVSLIGFGVFDGDYLVEESVHEMDRSQGYASRIEVVRWNRSEAE